MVAQYYNPSTVTTEARLGVWEQPRLHSARVSLQGGAYNRLDLLFFFFLSPCFISFSKFENISCMRICQNLYFQTSLEIPNLDIIYKELGISVFQNSSLIPALRIFHNQLVVHMSLSPTFKKKKQRNFFKLKGLGYSSVGSMLWLACTKPWISSQHQTECDRKFLLFQYLGGGNRRMKTGLHKIGGQLGLREVSYRKILVLVALKSQVQLPLGLKYLIAQLEVWKEIRHF